MPEQVKYEVVWEEPPAANAGRGWNRSYEEFRPFLERPQQWARVRVMNGRTRASSAGQLAKQLRHSLGGTWEVTTRKLAENALAVYVRYMGPGEAP